MQFSFVKSCLVALAAVSGVIAQNPTEGFDVFTQPDPNSPGASISAGSNYNIKWNPTKPTGPISIYLLQGSSNRTLMLGDAVATGIDSSTGSYQWKVPTVMAPIFATYGFKLQLDADPTIFQYSTYFSITGLSISSSSSAGTATVTVQVSSVSGGSLTAITTIAPTNSSSTSGANSTTSASSSTDTGAAAASANSTTTVTTSGTSTRSGTGTALATGVSGTTSAAATRTTAASAAANLIVGSTGVFGALLAALQLLL